MSDDSIKSTVSCIAVLCGIVLYAVHTDHGRQTMQQMTTVAAVDTADDHHRLLALEAERRRLADEVEELRLETERQRARSEERVEAIAAEQEAERANRSAQRRYEADMERLRQEEDEAALARARGEQARREAEEATARWVAADHTARLEAERARQQALRDAASPTEPAAYTGPYFNVPPRHARPHQRPIHQHDEELAAKSRR